MTKVILSVCSARPNFVKLAAVHHALAKHHGFNHVIVHTGQHYDPLLSDVFFTQLNIPQPDFNLGVKGMNDREGVIEATAEAMMSVLEKAKPDVVLVYGDVNGAVGAARAAKKLGIKIGHVEAGLRSFDNTMPEELNRIEVDGLADILFCSEQSGVDHLKKEKAKGEVHLVGNTMIDTLIDMIDMSRDEELPESVPSKFFVATIHRPSNVDDSDKLMKVMEFLNTIGGYAKAVLPMHPRTRHILDGMKDASGFKNVIVIDPLGYLAFIHLMSRGLFIITDSGGVQEEATYLKKRCFTLRKNTERPSTIESGSNVLIDIDKPEDCQTVLNYAAHAKAPPVTIPEKWDGKTGERIVVLL